jgi:hypothetical protein
MGLLAGVGRCRVNVGGVWDGRGVTPEKLRECVNLAYTGVG